MDLQKLLNAIGETSRKERSKYHSTFGDLIDALRRADDDARITPKIVGVSAYRGYYSDIALCTESVGIFASKKALDYNTLTETLAEFHKKNAIKIQELPKSPKAIADVLESLIGSYFDGYKGGYNEITREKPLWIATDYGNCSDVAVIEITDKLELITKDVE